MKKYSLVAVGGTFDRLHCGHKELLKTAFKTGEKVIIGITDAEMTLSKQMSKIILPFEKRKEDVINFLSENHWLERAEIVVLRDPYGPLLRNERIESVVVGPKVDEAVIKKLERKVAIIKCQNITSNDGDLLSSARIRLGEVSRTGSLYLLGDNNLAISDPLRHFLKKPFGELVKNLNPEEIKQSSLIITVGDETTKLFNKKNIKTGLAIVDFKIKREKVFSSFTELGFPEDTSSSYEIGQVVNPAGSITSVLSSKIKEAIKNYLQSGKRTIVLIDGEDDLAVLPAVTYSPLETLIFYGQPNEGLVKIKVTEAKKEEVKKLLKDL